MKIKCGQCRYEEKATVELFVKIIGGALPFGGFAAWVTYLFAGTGFAIEIVIAIITGGIAMLIFKDQIVEWIVNRGYKCPRCGSVNWKT